MKGHTAYELKGEGPNVVLIHGLGLNRAMWQWQVPALAAEFTVLTYDLYGQGDSEGLHGDYSMQRMTDQLSDVMDNAGMTKAAIVGFSLGGLIARAFTLAHPGRVSGLAVLNSAHARTAEQRAAVLKRVAHAESNGPASTADAALERWFSDDFRDKHPEVMLKVREWIAANDAEAYLLLYRLLAEGDIGLETSIADIQCPALILTGEEDHGNSPAMAQAMADLMPGSDAVVLPGLRHMALVEDPGAVNAELLRFLRESSGR